MHISHVSGSHPAFGFQPHTTTLQLGHESTHKVATTVPQGSVASYKSRLPSFTASLHPSLVVWEDDSLDLPIEGPEMDAEKLAQECDEDFWLTYDRLAREKPENVSDDLLKVLEQPGAYERCYHDNPSLMQTVSESYHEDSRFKDRITQLEKKAKSVHKHAHIVISRFLTHFSKLMSARKQKSEVKRSTDIERRIYIPGYSNNMSPATIKAVTGGTIGAVAGVALLGLAWCYCRGLHFRSPRAEDPGAPQGLPLGAV